MFAMERGRAGSVIPFLSQDSINFSTTLSDGDERERKEKKKGSGGGGLTDRMSVMAGKGLAAMKGAVGIMSLSSLESISSSLSGGGKRKWL